MGILESRLPAASEESLQEYGDAVTQTTEAVSATRTSAARAETVDRLDGRTFKLGVGACTAGVAAFLLVQLQAWPPHEDETLALFVGRKSLGSLMHTVLG